MKVKFSLRLTFVGLFVLQAIETDLETSFRDDYWRSEFVLEQNIREQEHFQQINLAMKRK